MYYCIVEVFWFVYVKRILFGDFKFVDVIEVVCNMIFEFFVV